MIIHEQEGKEAVSHLLRLWGEGYSTRHLQRACMLFGCRNSSCFA